MSKVWIPTIANFFLPGAGYLILGVKRALSLMWLPGFVALTIVEFGIQDSEPNLYWLMFAAVFVINLAFAIDVYQLAQEKAEQAA
ncbi:MAG: hypothetical protein QNJ88_02710 [Acidimicrobiia bacterium]|nr:hypothetical protein [Acidimicrobiia bacterium]